MPDSSQAKTLKADLVSRLHFLQPQISLARWGNSVVGIAGGFRGTTTVHSLLLHVPVGILQPPGPFRQRLALCRRRVSCTSDRLTSSIASLNVNISQNIPCLDALSQRSRSVFICCKAQSSERPILQVDFSRSSCVRIRLGSVNWAAVPVDSTVRRFLLRRAGRRGVGRPNRRSVSFSSAGMLTS